MGNAPPLSDHRPTIGFLVNSLLDAYQLALWQGVTAEADRLGVNLLCFVAGLFGAGYRNLSHDLVDPARIDALVVLSAAVSANLSPADLAAEFERFGKIPLVSIGMEIPGAVNLLADGAPGIERMMDHLVEVHGRRRIAFIRGPQNHPEAEARYAAYRRSLERHGLPWEPDRVFLGDFDRNSGGRAVHAFLDDRNVPLDAIVAANDYMGLYAMTELQRRGVRVPEEVAVCGFDDIRDAACVEPMFTTVRQPLAEIAREAVAWALKVAAGEPGPAVKWFPTDFVGRRSCGCFPGVEPVAWSGSTAAASAEERPDAERTARALEEAFPDLAPRLGVPGWAAELAAPLTRLGAEGPAPFLAALDGVLGRTLAAGIPAERWFTVVTACLASPAASDAGRDVLDAARAAAMRLVAGRLEQGLVRYRVRAEEQFEILQLIAGLGQIVQQDIREVLAEKVPQLGVSRFLLCRYRDARRLEAARFLDVAPGRPAVAGAADELLPARALVPGRSGDGRESWVVAPVVDPGDATRHWGFTVCALGDLQPVAYESIALHVATALKVGALLAHEREHADVLEATVEERTGELRAAHSKLLELARQAGMAEVAVGVLHNVGNLLNSVSVCAEQIYESRLGPHLDALDRANAMLVEHGGDLGAFFSTDPRAAQLTHYYTGLGVALRREGDRVQHEALELLERIALVRDTIRSLQEFAGGSQDLMLWEVGDLAELVESALRIQAANLAREGVRVERAMSRTRPLRLQRSKVVHVLVNLVKNAVEAMRDTPSDARRLVVELVPEGEGARVRVIDGGEGIAPQHLGRVFEYGFTTKRDGHGFGLHTCANVMRELGGSIEVSAGPGRGATFTLIFPGADQDAA
jgi:DNA-binding LacI/PurR family transcriptional regulator/signal transduction histidine kinase